MTDLRNLWDKLPNPFHRTKQLGGTDDLSPVILRTAEYRDKDDELFIQYRVATNAILRDPVIQTLTAETSPEEANEVFDRLGLWHMRMEFKSRTGQTIFIPPRIVIGIPEFNLLHVNYHAGVMMNDPPWTLKDEHKRGGTGEKINVPCSIAFGDYGDVLQATSKRSKTSDIRLNEKQRDLLGRLFPVRDITDFAMSTDFAPRSGLPYSVIRDPAIHVPALAQYYSRSNHMQPPSPQQ